MTNRPAILAIAAVLASALLVFADDEAKSPLPNDAAIEKARTLVEEVFGQEWKDAKSDQQRRTLAKKMLSTAVKSPSPNNRYVLLRVARDIATQGGDVATAFRAIDEMARTYQVAPIRMKASVLYCFSQKARLPAHHRSVAEQSLSLLNDAVSRDDFLTAAKLVKMAQDEARKARDAELAKIVEIRKQELDGFAAAFESVQAAAKVLETNPTDPSANLAVGKYRCFAKGDWDSGLPMLALGSDPALKALAAKELEETADPMQQIKLGDGWWSLGEAEVGTAKARLQGRAVLWYGKAVPKLSGLTKVRVEKRLKEATIFRETAGQTSAEPRPAVSQEGGSQPEDPTKVAGQRLPVPDETARSRARTEIRSLYEEEYRLAHQPVDKVDLAKKLMAVVGRTADDPAGIYALLEEARSLAVEAGDGDLAISIVEALARRFDVDEWVLKVDVVREQSAAAKTLPERGAVYKVAVKLAEEAAKAETYGSAIELLGIADRLARRGRAYALAKACRTRIRELTAEKQQWELARQARAKLADDPDDPAANRVLGLFLCFVRDVWEQGLPLLVKANDPGLEHVLEQEVNPPSDAPRQARLGDLWWDTASRAAGSEKLQFTARACHWYRQAVVGLEGLEKARVERLLEKHDPLWGQVAVGLVGHWKLDEGQGEAALDATGNQNGKYLGSLAWSREGGRVVAMFDAKSTAVELGRRDFGNVFSVAVWIKPLGSNSTARDYCVFANEYVRADLAGIRLRVRCDGTPQGDLRLETNNGSNKSATTPRGVLRLDQWHHVAVLVNRAAGTASIYVNGRDATEKSEIWPNFKNESSRWWIGGARGLYGDHIFRGSMSDFRLYNRLLSPREITALARMGNPN